MSAIIPRWSSYHVYIAHAPNADDFLPSVHLHRIVMANPIILMSFMLYLVLVSVMTAMVQSCSRVHSLKLRIFLRLVLF